MSTGYECTIFATAPEKWYYVLQNGNCPVGAWDWTEYAHVVGPFASSQLAETYICDHEANPGGWSIIDPPTVDSPTNGRKRYDDLAAKATPPRSSRRRF